MQEIAELISLGMTFPTIVLALSVIYTWFPSARRAVKTDNPQAQDWFIVGVVAGFIGSALDNIYWFFPWSAAFLDHPAFVTLTNLGVFFNIFFRQGLGIVAAYCHLKAAEKTDSLKMKLVNNLLLASNLLGLSYTVFLILTKVV
jgi:hypothetical protein